MADILTWKAFNAWLEQYRKAWENCDANAAATLFTNDAEYYWTPFEEPKRGQDEIAVAWKDATSRQQDVHFTYTILAVTNRTGIVHWHTSFTRITTGKHVELDGIIMAEFDSDHTCRVFREWWHSSE